MIVALPISEEDKIEPRLSSNQLFHQLNELLKREIEKETKNDSLEVGDNVKADDGKLQISVQSYSSSQGFPISFEPQDKEVLEDKEIITIVNDFSGSSEYVIKKDSSEEDSKESLEKASTAKPNTLSTVKVDEKASTEKTPVEKASVKAPADSTTDKALADSTKEKAPVKAPADSTTVKASADSTTDKASVSTEKSSLAPKKEESSTKKQNESSTPSTPTAESTTNKHEKLLKDIAEEPVILTHI